MTMIDRNVKYVVEVFEGGENLFTAHSHVLSFAVGSFLDLCRRYGKHNFNEIDTFDTVGRGYPIVLDFGEAGEPLTQVQIYATPAQ